MAREVLDRYHHLDDAERLGFFSIPDPRLFSFRP